MACPRWARWLCDPALCEDNGGWGRRVTLGAPFIYKSPKSCWQTRPTITARAGRQAFALLPCHQSQLQPRPKCLTCGHNGPTPHEGCQRAPTAGGPGTRAGAEPRGHPGRGEDAQRPVSLQTQALLSKAAVQGPQETALLEPQAPQTPQRFGLSLTLTLGLAQRGSGKLVKPRDPAASDRPQTPAPPRTPRRPYDHNFLCSKRLQKEEEKIQ